MTIPSHSAMLAMAAELRDGDTGWSGDAACVATEGAERAADMFEALAQPAPLSVPADAAQPVAFRVKDFADGWILCHSRDFADSMAHDYGSLVQPLYAACLLY